MKVKKAFYTPERPGYMVYCPGCECHHFLESGRWSFNEDINNPTFTPSLLITTSDDKRDNIHLCHSFIRNGKIEFLSDCEHKFAGQTIDLPEIEDIEWKLT